MANDGNRPKTTLRQSEERDDQDMRELFSALDGVSASQEVRQRTLDAIARMAHEEAQQEPGRQEEGSQGKAQAVVATIQPRNAHNTRKAPSRWRAIRIAAVAACLAFACVGGVAYALPAAHVTVETAQGSVELEVNRFGRTLSATASSQALQETVDGLNVRNKGYEESLGMMIDELGPAPDGAAGLTIESQDERIRDDLEQRGKEEIELKEAEFAAREQELQPPVDAAGQAAPAAGEAWSETAQDVREPQAGEPDLQGREQAATPPATGEQAPGGTQAPGQVQPNEAGNLASEGGGGLAANADGQAQPQVQPEGQGQQGGQVQPEGQGQLGDQVQPGGQASEQPRGQGQAQEPSGQDGGMPPQ